MLLLGRHLKGVKVNFSHQGFENNSSFTKFLVTPVRDSSITAAHRAKSATTRNRKHEIQRKLKKLNSLKKILACEKESILEYEKYADFSNRINDIIETRWKLEVNAAILIQSAFRGYYNRKRYLQKRIEIDRELTKKLIVEMQYYSDACFTSLIGSKAAITIQKNVRRFLAMRLLRKSILQIKAKIANEKRCSLNIQTKFRQFLSREVIEEKIFEKQKDAKLNIFFIKEKARTLVRFLRKNVERRKREREEKHKAFEASIRRRKGLLNSKKKLRSPERKNTLLSRLATLAEEHAEELGFIPNIYTIFRPVSSRGRALTPAERTQMQTESSSMRRRSIVIKRNIPKLPVPTCAKLIEDETDSKSRTKGNQSGFTSYLKDTECSYNRINYIEPHTPEPNNSNKSRKINWTFLKPTISSELGKASRLHTSVKSTVHSTHSSRAQTPSVSNQFRLSSMRF